VLEILQDGFRLPALARRARTSRARRHLHQPEPDPQFNLRTGDTISGLIRPPKDGERYFALLKVGEINFDSPDNARSKVLFENLTPLHPTRRFKLERGTAAPKT
jgi:transcription termination factor Rho